MIRSLETVSKLRLQAQKLEKEEAARAIRNEAKSAHRAETSRDEPQVIPELRNEAKLSGVAGVDEPPAMSPQGSRPAELGARCARPQPPALVMPDAGLRNEANFELDGVEWIEIPPIGQGGTGGVSYRAAS